MSVDVELFPVVECTCDGVEIGSYDAHVTLQAPWGALVDIDRCLVPLVLALWAARIRTVASCCGHGMFAPSLIIRVPDQPDYVCSELEELRRELGRLRQEHQP